MSEALYFEVDGARLFAVESAPATGCSDVGVVICHPYGEERQFVDRVLVRFARHLAVSGFAALRFDRSGYGDSTGELADDGLERPVLETLAAADLFRRRVGVSRVVLLGLRFGGLIAALAAEREPHLAGLVLWSPIVSGKAYTSELIRKKLFAQIADRSGGKRDEILASLAADGMIEIEGHQLTRRLYDDVEKVDLASRSGRGGIPIYVGTPRKRSNSHRDLDALVDHYRRMGCEAELHVTDDREYWEDRPMFERVFPDELYGDTLRWLQSQWGASS